MPRGTNHYAKLQPEKVARGTKQGSAKLNEDAIIAIRKLNADGLTRAAIARLFAVSWATIDNVLNGKIWRHVP